MISVFWLSDDKKPSLKLAVECFFKVGVMPGLISLGPPMPAIIFVEGGRPTPTCDVIKVV